MIVSLIFTSHLIQYTFRPSALIAARENLGSIPPTPKLLVVTQADPSLPIMAKEVNVIGQLVRVFRTVPGFTSPTMEIYALSSHLTHRSCSTCGEKGNITPMLEIGHRHSQDFSGRLSSSSWFTIGETAHSFNLTVRA